MISKKMQDLLNEQFHRELFSGNQYLAICSYFQELELDGFANFYRVQAQEELMHAMKQFDYVHQVGGRINMLQIPAPQNKFKSIQAAVELTLKHEREVTKHIGLLVKEAMNENDFATQAFLQWFVTEQVEEEALVTNLLAKIKMIGDNPTALFMLNAELAARKAEPDPNGATL
jgi:ferritin